MMKKVTSIVLFLTALSLATQLSAQQAGKSTYDFLNISSSARMGALGGNQVGLNTDNVDLVFHNPALLSEKTHQSISFNYVPYLDDIKVSYAGYAHHIDQFGTLALGVHTISYGTFERTDVNKNLNGQFSAAEYAIQLSYAKALSPRLRAGISIKPIISSLEQYNSFAIATDLGVFYHSLDNLFSAGIALKNFGSQISQYNNTNESLPTDLQIGVSKKLAHAPFRFSVTAQDLFDWDLKYEVNNGSGDPVDDAGNNGNGLDQVLRHFNLGVELLPSDNFFIAFGYNHRRRKELGASEKMSTSGLSWGVGFRISKFHFSYSSARYHLAGTSNHFSISTRLSNFGSSN